MIHELEAIARRVAELERRLAASGRQGVVSEVDPANGLVRLDLGDGMQSPWVPYSQTAGALKIHSPPSIGQQMILSAPSGETTQGIATPLSFGGSNAPPSTSGSEHVLTFGNVRVELTGSGLTITADGVVVEINGSGLTITGGMVRHDGTNIGATHVHGAVMSGPSNTSTPQ